jgi:hypothetical protein
MPRQKIIVKRRALRDRCIKALAQLGLTLERVNPPNCGKCGLYAVHGETDIRWPRKLHEIAKVLGVLRIYEEMSMAAYCDERDLSPLNPDLRN